MSHALNRDIWSNDVISSQVECGFVFWQRDHDSPEGAKFVETYKVESLPAICLIEPRTKRGETQEGKIRHLCSLNRRLNAIEIKS